MVKVKVKVKVRVKVRVSNFLLAFQIFWLFKHFFGDKSFNELGSIDSVPSGIPVFYSTFLAMK
jgi:hypothetical protein